MTVEDPSVLDDLSEQLLEAERTSQPIDPLTDRVDLTPGEAYEIQLLGVRKKQQNGARVTGKKIGLTSRGMQDLIGVDQPDYGHLLDDMAFMDGGTIPRDRLIQPRLEAEIGFLLGRDLQGPGISVLDVIDATEALVPTLEIVDSRVRDWNIGFLDTVADNASSGLYVTGVRTLNPRGTDLRTIGMILEHNGEIVQTGAGAASLGNPAYCVAWLANKLSEFDMVLEAGEIVLSGALSAAVDLEAGDHFRACFGGLGHVSCRFA